MDCIVHWVSKSWIPLSNFHFHNLFKIISFKRFTVNIKHKLEVNGWKKIYHANKKVRRLEGLY